jgi:hypothetical protein
MHSRRPLRVTLIVIGIVQVFFGLPFVIAPGLYSMVLHLSSAPAWTTWFFVMSGARFLGMAYGMFLAAYNPIRHKAWINAMIGIQALDWLGTMYSIATGAISLLQATDAPYLPLIFIAALLIWYPRGSRLAEVQSAHKQHSTSEVAS